MDLHAPYTKPAWLSSPLMEYVAPALAPVTLAVYEKYHRSGSASVPASLQVAMIVGAFKQYTHYYTLPVHYRLVQQPAARIIHIRDRDRQCRRKSGTDRKTIYYPVAQTYPRIVAADRVAAPVLARYIYGISESIIA